MRKRYLKQSKILNVFLTFCFLFNTFFSSAFGAVVPIMSAYNLQLPFLRYLSINSANPFNYFNFLLDQGLSPQGTVPNLNTEAKKLINYFFLGISLSADAFWVNLQPKDAHKMTSDELGRTDMGKVLLEQDLQLKKDVAKYLHPDNAYGKKFWERLYTEIGKDKVRREKITTSQRVWIVPDTATVVETTDGAFISEAKLKVLLENEYLKAQQGLSPPELTQSNPKGTVPLTAAEREIQILSESLMKEIIIPELSFDVNHSSAYAPLRQIYYSLILAEYFKRKQAQGLSPQGTDPKTKETVPKDSDPYISLINQNTTQGLESELPWSKDKIFQEYLNSYQKGEYQIKRSLLGLARMYFSGGIVAGKFAPPGATHIGVQEGMFTVVPNGSGLAKTEETLINKDGQASVLTEQKDNGDPINIKLKVLAGEETTGEAGKKAGSPLKYELYYGFYYDKFSRAIFRAGYIEIGKMKDGPYIRNLHIPWEIRDFVEQELNEAQKKHGITGKVTIRGTGITVDDIEGQALVLEIGRRPEDKTIDIHKIGKEIMDKAVKKVKEAQSASPASQIPKEAGSPVTFNLKKYSSLYKTAIEQTIELINDDISVHEAAWQKEALGEIKQILTGLSERMEKGKLYATYDEKGFLHLIEQDGSLAFYLYKAVLKLVNDGKFSEYFNEEVVKKNLSFLQKLPENYENNWISLMDGQGEIKVIYGDREWWKKASVDIVEYSFQCAIWYSSAENTELTVGIPGNAPMPLEIFINLAEAIRRFNAQKSQPAVTTEVKSETGQSAGSLNETSGEQSASPLISQEMVGNVAVGDNKQLTIKVRFDSTTGEYTIGFVSDNKTITTYRTNEFGIGLLTAMGPGLIDRLIKADILKYRIYLAIFTKDRNKAVAIERERKIYDRITAKIEELCEKAKQSIDYAAGSLIQDSHGQSSSPVVTTEEAVDFIGKLIELIKTGNFQRKWDKKDIDKLFDLIKFLERQKQGIQTDKKMFASLEEFHNFLIDSIAADDGQSKQMLVMATALVSLNRLDAIKPLEGNLTKDQYIILLEKMAEKKEEYINNSKKKAETANYGVIGLGLAISSAEKELEILRKEIEATERKGNAYSINIKSILTKHRSDEEEWKRTIEEVLQEDIKKETETTKEQSPTPQTEEGPKAGSPLMIGRGESRLDESINYNVTFGPGESRFDESMKPLGGIDLNQIKLSLKEYASSSPIEKKQAIGKLKTLLCIDALLDKKWFSLAHLYFQEIIRLLKDDIVADLQEERDELLIAARELKDKGYLVDREGLKFLELLESGRPVGLR